MPAKFKLVPPTEKLLWKKSEAAYQLGVTTWTIDRWLREGSFPKPVYLRKGGQPKWRMEDLRAFIEKRRRSRAPKSEPRGAASRTAHAGGGNA